MLKHWEEVGPPTYVVAAAYVGWGDKRGKGKRPSGDLNELAAMFASNNGVINGG